ncbi:MAG: glutamate 5-kinase [Proteobacteria bacterium]|nr:glutamate 5-kinase [Pseudomonadota bacterium]MDA1022797.1 glutamate 5-kinase [Pseudomonadota bacterium]
MTQSKELITGKRVVIKIGSSLLVDQEHGTVHRKWLQALAQDVAVLSGRGQEVIIVSSGAIAVGRRHLKLPAGVLKLDESQAAAATGMVRLAHAYQEVMAEHDLTVAQVLLTLDDSEDRRRYINARNTLGALIRLGAVPLINENDTVATDEIRFGDNDRLAARVAAMISADILVLLSDIDGLYTADPRQNPDADVISEVTEITPEIEAMAGEALTEDSRGGMITKLAAAKACLANGCRMVITDGTEMHPLKRLEDGAKATWFLPSATPKGARKRWIAGVLSPQGALLLDEGAVRALASGKSLLPAGVVGVEGEFQRGDAVVLKAADGRELGRGLVAYSAKDARMIMGYKTSEIETLLGYRGRDEMIHRDDLVVS